MERVTDTKKGGRRRFWSDEEKRLICLQTRALGVSVAQVARRYEMNANLIHTSQVQQLNA
jgi:transposase